jgi:hydrogenase expression/formation protein HypC
MCLAVPMKLLEQQGQSGVVEISGVRKQIMLTLTPDARIGNWLVVHAGYSLEILDEQEAEHTLSLLRELGASER